jgi:pyruvate formate lyase activating enzyme
MRLGGFQPLTLSDYPGHTACVIFSAGCNFRCPYCHNPELVYPEKYAPLYPREKVFAELETRKEFLEGVVISGGEPTVHQALPDFIAQVKELGFLVKLDTNGTNPVMLEKLLSAGVLDYVAMDIKAPFEKYGEVACVEMDFSCVKKSFELLCGCDVCVEFRTTRSAALCDEDMEKIRLMVPDRCKFTVQEQTRSS